MSKTLDDTGEVKESKSGIKPLLIAALTVGVVAAPAGWFLGQQTSNIPKTDQEKVVKDTHSQENNAALTPLPPILTNLREPQKTWLRMEISLVTDAPNSLTTEHLAEISSDFVALLQQMTLIQIKGPTGLMNLREDLLERARIRSEGKVSALLISNLVIE